MKEKSLVSTISAQKSVCVTKEVSEGVNRPLPVSFSSALYQRSLVNWFFSMVYVTKYEVLSLAPCPFRHLYSVQDIFGPTSSVSSWFLLQKSLRVSFRWSYDKPSWRYYWAGLADSVRVVPPYRGNSSRFSAKLNPLKVCRNRVHRKLASCIAYKSSPLKHLNW